jgi:hypothetical protein
MDVPGSLLVKEPVYSWWIGVLLFLAVLFLAVARVLHERIYPQLVVGMLKTQNLRVYLRENLPLVGGGAFFLLLNYWLSFGVLIYFLLATYPTETLNKALVAAVTPVTLLAFQTLSLTLAGWITGERQLFKAPIAMSYLGAQVLGVLFTICAIVWVLQPNWQIHIRDTIIVSFLLERAFRIIKSSYVVLKNGVSWYYIILYFCTLEILPYLAVFYLVWRV